MYVKPDAVTIHIVIKNILYNARQEDIARNIIWIGSNCKSHGVNDLFILSILDKNKPTLNALIKPVDDMSCDICVVNGFGFICIKKISFERWYPSSRSRHEYFTQELYFVILFCNFNLWISVYLVILITASD